jgi:hypothetical protein
VHRDYVVETGGKISVWKESLQKLELHWKTHTHTQQIDTNIHIYMYSVFIMYIILLSWNVGEENKVKLNYIRICPFKEKKK